MLIGFVLKPVIFTFNLRGGVMRKVLASLMLLLGVWAHVASADEGNYLLGAGDMLKITVYNNPDLTLETRITETGTISFPLLGEVELGGISASAAEKKLSNQLESGGFVKQAQINILVVQFQSKMVSILGSVFKPGRYPLDRSMNLTEVLALAGGVPADGSDMITVIGKSGKVEYDLRNIVKKGDGSQNINLVGGEIIYVPRAPMFYIYGEAQRPGSYRIERDMTVMQALAMGGGPTARGTQRGVQLHRRNTSGVVEVLSPELTDLVKQDDVLFIKESLF
jgi:polysaccharide export outer membrane protein